MSLFSFISSFVTVALSVALLFGLPLALIYRRFFAIPRCYLLLALAGLYCFFFYLKPAPAGLWPLPVGVYLVCFVAFRRLKGGREPFAAILKEWPAAGTLLYGFLLFLFRWEPPGVEPTKWGALTRALFETGAIPGDPPSLGVPVVMAVTYLPGLAPLERLINFFECASFTVFFFCLASALTLWFSRRTALVASLLAMAFFSNPQGYLAWGGTPALIGMTSGFCLLEVVKILLVRRPSTPELIVYALAFTFAAHAHPISFSLSLVVCAPVALWLFQGSARVKQAMVAFAAWGTMAILLFVPFLFRWRLGLADSGEEATRALGSVSLLDYFRSVPVALSLALWAVAVVRDPRQRFHLPALLMLGMVMLLGFDGKYWAFGASTLLVFPLTMILAWLLGQWEKGMTPAKRWVLGITLGMLALTAIGQFSKRLYPLLFASVLSENDRVAMAFIEAKVPWEECVDVRPGEAGVWIPVLALRCTVSFSGLGQRMVNSETGEVTERPRWSFYGDTEEKVERPQSEIVFDNGARLLLRK